MPNSFYSAVQFQVKAFVRSLLSRIQHGFYMENPYQSPQPGVQVGNGLKKNVHVAPRISFASVLLSTIVSAAHVIGGLMTFFLSGVAKDIAVQPQLGWQFFFGGIVFFIAAVYWIVVAICFVKRRKVRLNAIEIIEAVVITPVLGFIYKTF